MRFPGPPARDSGPPFAFRLTATRSRDNLLVTPGPKHPPASGFAARVGQTGRAFHGPWHRQVVQ